MNKWIVGFSLLVIFLASMSIGFFAGWIWGVHEIVIYSVDKAELTTTYVSVLRTYFNFTVNAISIQQKYDYDLKVPLVTFETLIYFMQANALDSCAYTETKDFGWIIWTQKGFTLYYWVVE